MRFDRPTSPARLLPLAAVLVLLHASTSVRSASAQTPAPSGGAARELVPGVATPGARALRAGEAAFALYGVQRGRRLPTALLWREIRIDTTVPRGRLTLVQRWDFPQGTTVDTSVVHLDTMEPIAYHGDVRDQTYALEFSAGRVQGTRTGSAGTAERVDVRSAAPFYNEVLDEIFAAAQPLADGYAYAYQAYTPGEPPRRLTVRVVGSERLPLTGGDSVDTWVVEQRGIQQLVVTWWLEKRTHDELRMRVRGPDGTEYGFLSLRSPERTGH